MILAVGEALVEIMRPRPGLPLGEPAEFTGPFASGAPAIFASVAARLGAPAALAAVVGDDPFGALIRGRLATDGVDTAHVRAMPAAATGCAFVAYDDAGGRDFVFHMGAAGELAEADLADLPERADWLHVSGSSLALSPAIAAVVESAAARVRAAGGRISLDPNLRAGAPIAARVRELARHATVLLPSEGELEALGLSTGAALVVCTTLGAAGARIGDEHIPAPEVDEVDPTGAGDTFAAAFAVATLDGAEPVEAARRAVLVAAEAVRHLGPIEAPVWPAGRAAVRERATP